jgi:hypothetical protein
MQKRTNADYVSQALLAESGITSAQIARKCLQAGAPTTLDRNTVELLLVQMIRVGKVDQRGNLYFATDRLGVADPPPAEHPDVKPAEKEAIGHPVEQPPVKGPDALTPKAICFELTRLVVKGMGWQKCCEAFKPIPLTDTGIYAHSAFAGYPIAKPLTVKVTTEPFEVAVNYFDRSPVLTANVDLALPLSTFSALYLEPAAAVICNALTKQDHPAPPERKQEETKARPSLMDAEEVQRRAVAMAIGEEFAVAFPAGVRPTEYTQQVRNRLINRVATQKWQWRVRVHRMDNSCVVTKLGMRDAGDAGTADDQIPAETVDAMRNHLKNAALQQPDLVECSRPALTSIPAIIRPVIEDLDRKMVLLMDVRRALMDLYGAEGE